jgi:hypothetical protein
VFHFCCIRERVADLETRTIREYGNKTPFIFTEFGNSTRFVHVDVVLLTIFVVSLIDLWLDWH